MPLSTVDPDTSLIGRIAAIGPAGHIYIGEGTGHGPRPLLVLLNGTGGSGRDLVEALVPVADSAGIVLLGLDPRRENFDAAEREGRLPQGFDRRFCDLWRYYLMYCEGGFRGGGIDVHQVTLVKQGESE